MAHQVIELIHQLFCLSDGYDGIGFVPGGASRIPNDTDSNSITDWVRNDFGFVPESQCAVICKCPIMNCIV